METVASFSAFDRVLIARDVDRPYSLDLIGHLVSDFQELHGDRRFADDPAIVAGFGRFENSQVAVIGHQKGHDLKQRQHRNFGMPKPEGYRKAIRLMRVAEKFGRPILTFIDTPGAYPGIDAEERGQAEAIAFCLREMASLRVPVIITVIGEGGSGGALAIGVGDYVLMMENAVYSVISPEGCAAILWKDSTKSDLAATSLKVTATDLKRLKLVDEIVPEPPGGAHADPAGAAEILKGHLSKSLYETIGLPLTTRMARRYQKLRNYGQWGVGSDASFPKVNGMD